MRGGEPRRLGGEREEALDGVAAARPMGGLTARDEDAPVGGDEPRGRRGAAHVHAEEQPVGIAVLAHRRCDPATT